VNGYKRLTTQDRLQISLLSKRGLNQTEVAAKLGFHRSTVSRELRRNKGGRGYRRPKQADSKALERQVWRSTSRKISPEMRRTVTKLLQKQWPPEQISKHLSFEGRESVSRETIYRFIYNDALGGGKLYRNLRFSHRRRKPRFPRASNDRRGQIQDARLIEESGAGANNRSRFGHWEIDTMIGANKKGALLVLADRKSRKIRLRKLRLRQAKKVNKAAQSILET